MKTYRVMGPAPYIGGADLPNAGGLQRDRARTAGAGRIHRLYRAAGRTAGEAKGGTGPPAGGQRDCGAAGAAGAAGAGAGAEAGASPCCWRSWSSTLPPEAGAAG